MKKFKFNSSDLGEMLTREELKMVYGGSNSSIGKGACNGLSADYISACSGKSEGDTCTYCIMQGTALEQLEHGVCKKPVDSIVVTQKRLYCD